jgi:DNA-binding NarL/FixJ family response regulator
MTIVLADIEASIREKLRKRLERITGVSVVGASSRSTEVTAMILNRNPDVAIVSSRLDGGSSIEVLRHIRQLMVPPTIIVVTNDFSRDNKNAYSVAGADFILEKVPDDRNVLNVIRLLCMTHRQIHALDSPICRAR